MRGGGQRQMYEAFQMKKQFRLFHVISMQAFLFFFKVADKSSSSGFSVLLGKIFVSIHCILE